MSSVLSVSNKKNASVVTKPRVSAKEKRLDKIETHRYEMHKWAKDWYVIKRNKELIASEIIGYEKTISELSVVIRGTTNIWVRSDLVESIGIFKDKLKVAEKNIKLVSKEETKVCNKYLTAKKKLGEYLIRDALANSTEETKLVIKQTNAYDKINAKKRIDLSRMWKKITSDDVLGYIAEFLPAEVRISLMEQRLDTSKMLANIYLRKKVKLFDTYKELRMITEKEKEEESKIGYGFMINDRIKLMLMHFKVCNPDIARKMTILIHILSH